MRGWEGGVESSVAVKWNIAEGKGSIQSCISTILGCGRRRQAYKSVFASCGPVTSSQWCELLKEAYQIVYMLHRGVQGGG